MLIQVPYHPASTCWRGAMVLLVCVSLVGLDRARLQAREKGRTRPAALSSRKAHDFARKVQETIQGGNPTVFGAALDGRALFEKGIAGLNLSAAMKQALFRGLNSRGSFGLQFGQNIASQIQASGSYRLLRVHSVGGKRRALFRMTSDQGLNYHDLYLEPDPKGGVRIVDIEVFLLGEPLSQTLRRAFLPAVVHENRNWLKRAVGWESSYIRHLRDIQRMVQMGQAQRYAEALKVYQSLPKDLQREKNMMVQRILYTDQLVLDSPERGAEYIQAVKEYRNLFPNDANIDMMLLDFYFLKGQWKQTLATIDRLDKKVGGDPYLNLYRGNVRISQGEIEKGKALLKQLIRDEPALPDPYYALIDQSLAEKNYAETTKLLMAVTRNAEVRFGDLTRAEGFEGYVQSRAYQDWVNYLEDQH